MGIVFLLVPLALFGTCFLIRGASAISMALFSKNISGMMSVIVFGTVSIIIGYSIFKFIINKIKKGPK
jgi:hypothetical protein